MYADLADLYLTIVLSVRTTDPNDVWVHVDKLSSPHIYIRLPPSIPDWQKIPEALLIDAAQLVKAGSIQGNKKDNVSVIYTPASNLKKTGDMDVGQVSFIKEKTVKRIHVATRENAIVNRLNKTKKEVVVDHEADLAARQKEAGRVKKAAAREAAQKEAELLAARKKDKEERSYDRLFSEEALEEANRNKADEDDDDFFM